jgi:hypothetical protein
MARHKWQVTGRDDAEGAAPLNTWSAVVALQCLRPGRDVPKPSTNLILGSTPADLNCPIKSRKVLQPGPLTPSRTVPGSRTMES